MRMHRHRTFPGYGVGLVLPLFIVFASAADPPEIQIQQLREENRKLREQLEGQRHRIDELNSKFAEMLRLHDTRGKEVQSLRDRIEGDTSDTPVRPGPLERIAISGEGGVAFFRSGSGSQFPKSSFRVDVLMAREL